MEVLRLLLHAHLAHCSPGTRASPGTCGNRAQFGNLTLWARGRALRRVVARSYTCIALYSCVSCILGAKSQQRRWFGFWDYDWVVNNPDSCRVETCTLRCAASKSCLCAICLCLRMAFGWLHVRAGVRGCSSVRMHVLKCVLEAFWATQQSCNPGMS